MGHSQKIDQLDRRPIVTFILFAYNQEEFIREAVEGALRQTYEPLEIVLSDDCSTDRTFEIMNEMASAYVGPHIVKTVRTPENLGLVDHVLTRGREASGDVVVVAAGDDISEPHRTARIAEAFASNPRLGVVGSWVADIDENGIVLQERRICLMPDGIIPRDNKQINMIALGCSAAYRRWVFDVPLSSADVRFGEDLLLSFYVNLLGAHIAFIEAPLVRYRKHAAALSNLVDTRVMQVEDYIRRAAEGRLQFLDESERIAAALNMEDRLDESEISRARAFALDAAQWPNLTFKQRLQRIVGGDYAGEFKPNWKRFAWRAVRLWGTFPAYQPKLLISWLRASFRRLVGLLSSA